MANPLTTRSSLLVRIRDLRDNDAWRQFVRLYAPLVYRFARRHRLQDADAADLTQEVLRAVSAGAERLTYDSERGSFRSWLFAMAHHKLCDFLTRQRRQCRGSGDSATHELLEEVLAKSEVAIWMQDYERQLFAWAADQVRSGCTDTTWQAFWQTAVEGRDAKLVARSLGLTIGAVYVAKSRIQARLKEHIDQIRLE